MTNIYFILMLILKQKNQSKVAALENRKNNVKLNKFTCYYKQQNLLELV